MPDGTVGTPYIVARGVEVISDIDLSPDGVTNPLGATHTVTATVTDDSSGSPAPVVGTTVTFTVIAGPHTGTTGTGVTNSSGMASFSYVGTALGTDTIEATFVDAAGRTQRSNRVTKIWEPAPPDPIAVLEAKADRLESKLDGQGGIIKNISIAIAALEGKADRLESKLDGQGGVIKNISIAIAALEGKADRLEGKADRLEGKADHLQTQFDAFDADVRATLSIFGGVLKALEAKADRLEGKADQLSADLTHRADIIDKGISKLESKADRLETKADHLQTQFDAFDADVRATLSIFDGVLKALEAKADRLEGKADQLSADLTHRADIIDKGISKLESKADRLETKADKIQSTLDNSIEHARVTLQVVDLSGDDDDRDDDKGKDDKHKGKVRSFLVYATEAGSPVSVSFEEVSVSKTGATWTNVTASTTVTNPKLGVYLVKIALPKGTTDSKLFEFRVKHTDGHTGATPFDRRGEKNLGHGQ